MGSMLSTMPRSAPMDPDRFRMAPHEPTDLIVFGCYIRKRDAAPREVLLKTNKGWLFSTYEVDPKRIYKFGMQTITDEDGDRMLQEGFRQISPEEYGKLKRP